MIMMPMLRLVCNEVLIIYVRQALVKAGMFQSVGS